MPTRSHLSIGEVLSLLREEFPDITISKIRFLESQGLVDPERTPSGYRKFYEHDVERLRWILRQQRENFLPLKVIRGRLSEQDPEGGEESLLLAEEPEPVHAAVAVAEEVAVELPPAVPVVEAPPPPPRPEPVRQAPVLAVVSAAAEEPATAAVAPAPVEAPPVRPAVADGDEVDTYTLAELAAAGGVTEAEVSGLREFGLLVPRSGAGGTAYYDGEALEVVRLASTFARHGVEARHLRAWKTGAEREVSLFEQVILPLLRQRNPQARHQAHETLDELADTGGRLREVLVRQALRLLH